MNTKQRFRSFIGAMPIMLERRKFMAQHSTRYKDEMPLPQSVNNFLNMIPHQYRYSALKWIATEGLRKASLNRRLIAKKYSEKYATDIGQDQIFSKMSYKNNPKLTALKNQIEQDWFDHDLEPRHIRVQGYAKEGIKMIDAYQINAHLEDMGLEPMYFGGENGLMEKIERGEWAVNQIHADSRDDKQGHDLSLAAGDNGIYSTVAREKENLKKQIRDAESSGDKAHANELIQQLRQISSSDSGSNLVKLGLNSKGGYVPSVEDKVYNQSIDKSASDSRDTIHRLYADIQAGKTFDELDGEEAQYLQKLMQHGKITSQKRNVMLRDLLGIIKGQLPPENLQIKDPKDIMHAKAVIKSVFKDLLSRDPSKPGGDYQVWPHAKNPALGLDSSGVLKPASVTIISNKKHDHSTHKILLDGKNAPTPENIDALADMLTDWMVDDDKGVTSKRVRIDRGEAKSGTSVIRYFINIENVDFLSKREPKDGSAGSKAYQALQKLGNQPIEVNFKGERQQSTPETMWAKVKGNEQESFAIGGKSIDPKDQQAELVPIKPENIEKELKGYKLVGKNKEGNVLTYKIPNTNIIKKIKVTQGTNGPEYAEYKPIEELKVDHDIKDPNNQVKEFGGGKYARINYGDGRPPIVARRSVNSLGHDVWYKINPAKEGSNEKPLLHPLSLSLNTGIAGVKPSMRPNDEKRNAMWNDFLQNWEDFGEDSPPNQYGVPNSVSKAAGVNKKTAQFGNQDDPINIVQARLLDQVSNPSFKFGDLVHKDDTQGDNIGRQKRSVDIYDLLNAFLTPEETDQVVSDVHRVLFSSPGAKTGPRTLVAHDGDKDPRLFVAPNSVRSDIYKAFLKNGFNWRVRQAGGTTRSLQSNHDAIAQGQGGDADETPQTDVADDSLEKYTNAKGEIDYDALLKDQEKSDSDGSGNDEYDDELYSADDQDDILVKRGDDAIDPSLAGLSQTELGPSNATVGSNTGSSWEREANPQGVKRNIDDMYSASKLAGDADKNIFVGRKRLGRQELPDDYQDLPPAAAQGGYDPDDDLAPSAAQGGYDPDDDLAPVATPQIFTPPAAPVAKPDYTQQKKAHHSAMNDLLGIKRREHTMLKGYDQWLAEQGGGAVYDPKVKVKDGGGFNWWGAVGDPLGVSISGKADTAKSDPTGKEGRLGKSRASGK
jgi:hypothetical protein